MSMLTLLGMSAIGIALIYLFHEQTVLERLLAGDNWWKQLGLGSAYGVVVTLIALLLLALAPLKEMQHFFNRMVRELNPTWGHIFFYSFCAAVGEEVLFRAGIQAFIGIWPTAFLFVLLHGYITPKSWRMSMYGLFLVLVSAGFGFLMEHFGLLSAITAHFVYDVIMFQRLKAARRNIG